MLPKHSVSILAAEYGFLGQLDWSRRRVAVGFDVLDLIGNRSTVTVPLRAYDLIEALPRTGDPMLCAVQLEVDSDGVRARSVIPQDQVQDDLRLLPGLRREVLRDNSVLAAALVRGMQAVGTEEAERRGRGRLVADAWLKAAIRYRLETEQWTSALAEALGDSRLAGLDEFFWVSEDGGRPPRSWRENDKTPIQALLATYQGSADVFGILFDLGSDTWCRSRLADLILSVDLELDGVGRIREIGVANAKGGHLRLEPAGADSGAHSGLRNLLHDLACARPLVVGHNIWHHDLPILREHAGCRLDQYGPIWDTLWVEMLLSFGRKTYALVSSERPHEAEYDAKAAAELCLEQLQSLPATFVRHLARAWKSGARGLRALIIALGSAFEESPSQHNLANVPKDELIAGNDLAMRLWRSPNVLKPAYAASLADRGGDIVDLDSLKRAIGLTERGQGNTRFVGEATSDETNDVGPEREFLLAIAEKTRSLGLQLYRRMLPAWIRDANSLHALLESSCVLGGAGIGGNGLMTPEFAIRGIASGKLRDIDITNLQDVLWLESICEIKQTAESDRNDDDELYGVAELASPEADGNVPSESIEYGTLTRPWRRNYGKRGRSTVARFKYPRSHPPSPGSDRVVEMPEWQYDDGWDDDAALWPTTANRYAYWGQILTWLRAIAADQRNRLLMVAVSDLQELDLVEQLASESEFGLTQPDPERSRLRRIEHLLSKDTPCLFVSQQQLRSWIQAARSLGGKARDRIRPVLLHVPFELWDHWRAIGPETACSQRESTRAALAGFLQPWVEGVLGCGSECEAPICLDYRVPLLLGRSSLLLGRTGVLGQKLDSRQELVLESYRPRFGVVREEPPPTDVESYRQFLEARWGYSDFRESQHAGLEAIVSSNADVLVTLPTGEGKSVLFQVPALLRTLHTGRLSIVITPLRALMQDQVRSLGGKGFHRSVEYITADRDPYTLQSVCQGINDGTIRLIYVAPERFQSRRFRRVLLERVRRDSGLDYVIFDEAHCLSEWGFEFRPDYLRAMRFINEQVRVNYSDNGESRVLLFSATVTSLVQRELQRIVQQGSEDDSRRPFLAVPEIPQWPLQPFIDLEPKLASETFGDDGVPEARAELVASLVADPNLQNGESSSIVFVSRRKDAAMLSAHLGAASDGDVDYFHAGMNRLRRNQVYERFRSRQISKLAATCAFGMGMDIPHIHQCIHFTPPKTLESLVQEIGRIGRDAEFRARANLERLTAYTLYSPGDFQWLNQRIERSRLSGDDLKRVWDHIAARTRNVEGERICFVPADWSVSEGDEEIRGDKTRLALFWLEECGRCHIESILPSMLELRLSKRRLSQASDIPSVGGRVASVLVRAAEGRIGTPRPATRLTNSAPAPTRGWLSEVIDSVLGFFFGAPNVDLTETASHLPYRSSLPKGDGQFNLLRVMEEAGLKSLDEVLDGLRELEGCAAVEIVRELVFERVRDRSTTAGPLQSTNRLCRRLLKKRAWTESDIAKDLIGAATTVTNENDGEAERRRRAAQRKRERETTAALSLLVGLGVLEEEVGNEGRMHYRRTPRYGKAAARIVDRVIKLAVDVFAKVRDAGGESCRISLSELLAMAGRKLRIERVRMALRLLDDLGMATCRQELIPMTYVLRVHSVNPLVLPHEGGEGPSESGDDKLARLFEMQDLAELRCAAVEVMLNLEDEEDRREFISSYFQSSDVSDLESTIETALELVPADRELVCSRSEAGQAKLKTKRNEAIEHLLASLRPESKRDTVRLAHDQNCLVNAGPGSGKTYLLEARVAFHVHASLRPEQIMLLAFNRAVVSEIRERVRRRFQTLGYGQYGRRVQCYTFHALAERYLRRLDPDDPRLVEPASEQAGNEPGARFDQRLGLFARLCETDSAYATKVMRGIRMVLVDEFQDLDEVKYRLLRALTAARGIAVTAVGDDDQDIVGFTRTHDAIMEGVEYFRRFTGEWVDVNRSAIELNMRSVPEIVLKANELAARTLGEDRMKADIELKAERESRPESVIRRDGHMDSKEVAGHIRRLTGERGARTVAVLCRTNGEAFQLSTELAQELKEIRLQTVAGSARLRLTQSRAWSELLDVIKAWGGAQRGKRINDTAMEEIGQRFASLPIPEASAFDKMMHEIMNITKAEHGRPRVADLEESMSQLSTTDLVWLGLKKQEKPRFSPDVVVTVVHRVKGLEFDAVVIPPSDAPFPLTRNADLFTESREEARIFYVGMTRARNDLVVGFDQRERAWLSTKGPQQWKVNGSGQRWLDGDPKYLILNASGESSELREYLREQVAKGDPVELRPQRMCYGIWHGEKRIGVTSRWAGKPASSSAVEDGCHVVDLYRFEPRDEWLGRLLEKDPSYPGWHYVPLIQGRIRGSG